MADGVSPEQVINQMRETAGQGVRLAPRSAVGGGGALIATTGAATPEGGRTVHLEGSGRDNRQSWQEIHDNKGNLVGGTGSITTAAGGELRFTADNHGWRRAAFESRTLNASIGHAWTEQESRRVADSLRDERSVSELLRDSKSWADSHNVDVAFARDVASTYRTHRDAQHGLARSTSDTHSSSEHDNLTAGVNVGGGLGIGLGKKPSSGGGTGLGIGIEGHGGYSVGKDNTSSKTATSTTTAGETSGWSSADQETMNRSIREASSRHLQRQAAADTSSGHTTGSGHTSSDEASVSTSNEASVRTNAMNQVLDRVEQDRFGDIADPRERSLSAANYLEGLATSSDQAHQAELQQVVMSALGHVAPAGPATARVESSSAEVQQAVETQSTATTPMVQAAAGRANQAGGGYYNPSLGGGSVHAPEQHAAQTDTSKAMEAERFKESQIPSSVRSEVAHGAANLAVKGAEALQKSAKGAIKEAAPATNWNDQTATDSAKALGDTFRENAAPIVPSNPRRN